MSKKSKFNFSTEKISLDEQYILGSDSGQMETRTVNALFVEMQHMEQHCCEISEGQWITWCDLCLRGWSSVSSTQGNALITKCPPKIYLSKYCPSEMPFPPPSSSHCGKEGQPPAYLLPTWWWGQQLGRKWEWVRFFSPMSEKFDKIPKLTFSPFGENVNFGILSKLTFHSLMKEKLLGNKVNKCPAANIANTNLIIWYLYLFLYWMERPQQDRFVQALVEAISACIPTIHILVLFLSVRPGVY